METQKKQKQKEIDHDIVMRMFENLKGRIHLPKESGDGPSSLIKFYNTWYVLCNLFLAKN
jgi:hypothetical protein